ncbi:hypothetical protein [Xenorhabdus lircayensis]|uniref:hypothetical protein n=1 Tax=Xenorhabdus lircayensis TaxID=2763499 RepID=UPI001E28DA0C|nr:hypothetical protein [Xenorhabdus lircayensis]
MKADNQLSNVGEETVTDKQNIHDFLVTPFEKALGRLQCVLVARRTITNPEGVSWAQYDTLHLLRQFQPMNLKSWDLPVLRPLKFYVH